MTKIKIRLTMSKILTFIYLAVIMAGVARTYIKESVNVAALPIEKKNIVIDAGHGGWDPGKTVGSTHEKDINLAIAANLQTYLEQGGAVVTTTRTEDEALSEEKRADLKNRKKLAEGKGVDMFVSIHQNSFPTKSAKGAQVFYFKKSEEGKELATYIQDRLREVVDIDNTRVAKANTDYYLLKDSVVPSVIVECGFLSNNEDYNNLTREDYQEKIAWSIYMGILDYYGERIA